MIKNFKDYLDSIKCLTEEGLPLKELLEKYDLEFYDYTPLILWFPEDKVYMYIVSQHDCEFEIRVVDFNKMIPDSLFYIDNLPLSIIDVKYDTLRKRMHIDLKYHGLEDNIKETMDDLVYHDFVYYYITIGELLEKYTNKKTHLVIDQNIYGDIIE